MERPTEEMKRPREEAARKLPPWAAREAAFEEDLDRSTWTEPCDRYKRQCSSGGGQAGDSSSSSRHPFDDMLPGDLSLLQEMTEPQVLSAAMKETALGTLTSAAVRTVPIKATPPIFSFQGHAAPVEALGGENGKIGAAEVALRVDCHIGSEDNVGDVLVSVASESTGKAQTCRNELFSLFGMWVGWDDKALPKEEREEQDKALRNKARKIYIDKLRQQGLTVVYQHFANGSSSVTVSWEGFKMEREV